ncbi:spermidine synthase [Bisgaardia hudsonensis]|uniref:Spermidine synthase n=1 Tax=Bisgaardia hudsonensis TaxID=109472 RepID=A0A4R2MU21_9PAST|nr:hypothetical protein [Bisgaardia hudsonensis]TCP12042.1 spermidine synthase [Bisgaardia hudsonensis]
MTRKAMLLSFLGGFLSLSIEIIWIRLFTFSYPLPQFFSLTLAIFLVGIAIGAFIGKRICNEEKASINYIGRIFILAALLDILAILGIIYSVQPTTLLVLGLSVLLCSVVRGIIFPIVHHLGSEKQKTGAAISNVYFSNVIGCTLAPIIVGFYLLDIFSTQQTYLLIIASTFFVAYFCISSKLLKITAIVLGALSIISLVQLPEKIITALAQNEGIKLEKLIENKHGFIQIYRDKNNEQIVFGNNVYDGKLNIDLLNNTNMIDRAYMLPIIAPDAKNILVIGLSTGSWVDVLTSVPTLESITVVELNPDYNEFADFYPPMAELLKDKRVNVIADDGRRWLNKHPDKKFDYILMNTTWYWRSYTTNLLSKEFLSLAKERLNPNGFIYFNTTGFHDSFYTSKSVYPYVYQYKNMSLASLIPIKKPTEDEISKSLAKLVFQKNNKPVFNSDIQLANATDEMMKYPIIDYHDIDFTRLGRAPEVTTDYNMIPEYKYGFLSTKPE